MNIRLLPYTATVRKIADQTLFGLDFLNPVYVEELASWKEKAQSVISDSIGRFDMPKKG
ncbi:hypothetical protein [Thiothrix lacustris]|uniref:hypothetical protein n=1 Tax=Thiothrix lacustris TaxID=525917 RepID=UPI0027E4BF9D|nr:hypothetical protein [Thiothrix lacustris]WMP19254.1 hypothetical protein RCS87_09445 [Thiothrix lacustris]